ncbi:MAG: hypothetical protein D6706_16625 [Chloroflexi bacterium]|nr:MAG: hypothetical protein D6706_16625 [Chloroflexota bacterium]
MTIYLLAILAVWRLARMLAYEEFVFSLFVKMRRYIASRDNIPLWVLSGITCPLCLSFWIALPVAFLIKSQSESLWLRWLGIAGGAAFLERLTK